MSLFQQELLAQLENDIFNLESQLKKRLASLSMTQSGSDRKSDNNYSDEQIEGLLRFNQRLSIVERHLLALGQTQNERMTEKVTDTNDPKIYLHEHPDFVDLRGVADERKIDL